MRSKIYVDIEAGLMYETSLHPKNPFFKATGRNVEVEVLELNHIQIDGKIYRIEGTIYDLELIEEVRDNA